MKFSLALSAAIALAGLLADPSPAAAGSEEPSARWSRCHAAGIDEPVSCVQFSVPLDWERPDGETLTLHATIVPAISGRPHPDPLVVLAGGPGQAAGDYGRLVAAAFGPLRRTRDIVLLDQRGTGRSVGLRCELTSSPFDAFDLGSVAREVRECAQAAPLDPRFFSSMEVTRDIERLREVLGAHKINLWGGSFGTRLAQHYVRAYPERVRSVVLDAALPADTPLFASAPASSQAAWDKLVRACANAQACNARFPDLDARLKDLLGRLGDAPALVTMRDPTTGDPTMITIDRELVGETIRGALYVPANAAVVPWAVSRATHGDYGPLAALAHATAAWSADTMYVGATLSILCSEEVPRLDANAARRAAGSAFVGDTYFRIWRAACDAWPEREIDARWLAPVRSNVPALVLSGATDPVTPPALGERAARSFATAVHAIAPFGGHTISAQGCAPDLIADFVDRPAAADIDTGCLATTIDPVPFTLGALGPVATGDQT